VRFRMETQANLKRETTLQSVAPGALGAVGEIASSLAAT
jgi:hypothetical protein